MQPHLGALGPGRDNLFEQAQAQVHTASRSFAIGEPWQLWVYVLPFVTFALLSYVLYGREGGLGLRPFLAYVFPWRMWWHRSSAVDLQVLVANRLLLPVISAVAVTATAMVGAATSRLLGELWPGHDPAPGAASAVVLTLTLALAYDLATFTSHMLHHRVPALWEIHKLHHSAEVLTPLTAFRHHPVYEIVSRALEVIVVGPLLGALLFWYSGTVTALTVFGVNLVFLAFTALGGTLRHSHMWISFGPVLSRIFISPAQHQIHHSVDPRHYDRNFGEIFAIWDWMAGTLYVPRERETLTFGVTEPQEHTNLLRAYTLPLRRALGRRARAPDSVAPGR